MQSVTFALDQKIRIFFELVAARFKLEDIFWCFSFSGGKDSTGLYALVKRFYEANNVALQGMGLHINQWGFDLTSIIKLNGVDIDITTVDSSIETRDVLNYTYGQQAPCRKCADLRRTVTDRTISDHAPAGRIVFIARGLHLTDTAISIFWRHLLSPKRLEDILLGQKYQPIAALPGYNNRFLVKPLFLVREFELQQYAEEGGFQSGCCGCPACFFPSRRDIIEEMCEDILSDDLWEFDIPGIKEYLSLHCGSGTAAVARHLSVAGKERKTGHIPKQFFDRGATCDPRPDVLVELTTWLNHICGRELESELARRCLRKFEACFGTGWERSIFHFEEPLSRSYLDTDIDLCNVCNRIKEFYSTCTIHHCGNGGCWQR